VAERMICAMSVQVFISHISEEHELAIRLKQRLEKDFLNQVAVFVSSDQESIQAGASWLDAVRSSLETSVLQIVLCSRASVIRPWINFEAGAAWLRGIPVVPLCHSGLGPDDLTMPLSALQGGAVSDPQALARLYQRIAELVPCGRPDLNWRSVAKQLSTVKMAIDAADVATVGRPGLPQGEPGLAELRIAAEVGDEKAMQAIAVQQSPEAWSMLMDLAVSNVDEQIRRDAIKKLGSFRTPGDIAPLCDLLIYSEFGVTDDCANVLARFRDPAAIPFLIKAADQHVDWMTTRSCVRALGAFAPQQPEKVCPALMRALQRGSGSFEGESASQTLLRYGPAALPYLLDAIEKSSQPEFIILPMKTVAQIGDKQVLPRLNGLRDKWQAESEGTVRDGIIAEIDKSISQLSG
jgi:hypothetical protein